MTALHYLWAIPTSGLVMLGLVLVVALCDVVKGRKRPE